jgi:hypothetical protein
VVLGGEVDRSTHIQINRIMKLSKHWKMGGGRGRLRECNREVNLFEVHCTHLYNYHNVIPLNY